MICLRSHSRAENRLNQLNLRNPTSEPVSARAGLGLRGGLVMVAVVMRHVTTSEAQGSWANHREAAIAAQASLQVRS